MIMDQKDIWGVSIEDEVVCMECVKEEECEGKSLDSFFYEGSVQFNGSLTAALMFCDRCHRYMKCSWAFIDREFEKMKVADELREKREADARGMVEVLTKNGFSINQIQGVMSVPYSIESKDGHIEITEDPPF